MEESIKSGALSSSSTEFQIGTLVLRSGTTFASEPFAVFLLWALLVVLAPFWGSGSLAGGISPSSATSLPFFSLFLFFFGGLARKVLLGIGMGARGGMDASGVDPPACDSNNSSRLVFLCWSTMASSTLVVSWLLLICVEGRGRREMVGESTVSGQSNTSKSSSSESTTSNILTNSSCVESEEITSSLMARWPKSLT